MASREKLRWGVLGTADIAIRQVIPATQQSQSGRVAAIASRTEARAAEVARMLDIERHYGSYERLLADPDVDAIYIPLPNSMHLEWAIKSAEAGKHILCEKPLGITADECRQMVKAARENNVLLTEAFWYRHHPQNLLVKDLIAQERWERSRSSAVPFKVRRLTRETISGFRLSSPAARFWMVVAIQ